MKTIPNFSRYAADESGNIYSLNYKNSGKTKIIKPSPRDGYYQSMFQRDDGKYCTYKIHKMVMLAFFGERPKGMEVNHKDGNKLNNSVLNLEYITHAANCQHSFDLGLQLPKRGTLNGMAKITEQQVKEIREYVANSKSMYYGRKALAEKYGISEAHVKDIVNRRRNIWPHV